MVLVASTADGATRVRILESDTISVLSSAGSHSWIKLRDKPGMAAVYFRQYSDWEPGGAIFDPLCRIFITRHDSKLSLSRKSYSWKATSAEAAFSSNDGQVRLDETVSYADTDVILTEFTVSNDGDESVQVTLAGQASSRGTIDAATYDNGEIGFHLKAAGGNMWGQELQLNESFLFAFRGLEAPPTVQPLGYRRKFDLAPGSRISFTAGFAHADNAAELREALDNPLQARERMTQRLESWMAELPLRDEMDEDRRRLCSASWYWIWYSVEHARGLWNRDIITPSKSAYGRGVWLWDSGFHIQALLLGGDQALQWAADQIDVLCANLVDGHLPREVWEDVVGRDLQAPGILTWAAMEIHKRTGDTAFLERIYPALTSNNNWFYANRKADDVDLCWWDHADSGWDTSPRWDDGPCLAIDLNAWLYLDQVLLARMADALGKPDADHWLEKAERTKSLINDYLWNEQDGCYYDLLLNPRRQTGVKSPAMYWPLFAGIAGQEQASRMVWYLNDPAVFSTPWRLPCVSANHPAFEAGNYWRGPVWINLNWLTILGLRRYGLDGDADTLQNQTVELIERNPVPYEYYNPLTGEGIGAANYMWTAAIHLVLTLGDTPAPDITAR